MILVGDIGGTKTRLARYELRDKKFVRLEVETFASRDFDEFHETLELFFREKNADVSQVCFGVPGPIIAGEAQATNLPWRVEEKTIAKILNVPRVKLVNDLVATASAIPYLSAEDLCVLYQGKNSPRSTAPRVVLAPGTGLGQAFLMSNSGKSQAYPTECGHIDFAPTTDLEIEMLQYLMARYGRASYERILCGPGLVNLYEFFKQAKQVPEPPALKNRLQNEDSATVISSAGQAGEFEICVKALDMFVSILGMLAGNLVFSFLATGGVYLGGGIAPKMLTKLAEGLLVERYLNRGRLSYLVEQTSLAVIKDDHAALLGAASIASSFQESPD